jgi:hypothetical protein
MSKYAKPKRNVANFNADNFEAELVKSTTDVLKITKNEIQTQTQTKLGFYNIGDYNFTAGSINAFIQNNTLDKMLDENMKFISSGTYHIRLMLNIRPRTTLNLQLRCSNSSLTQHFKIQSTLYHQVIYENFIHFDAGDYLFFEILDPGGTQVIIPDGDFRLMSSVLYVQQVSSLNVLV